MKIRKKYLIKKIFLFSSMPQQQKEIEEKQQKNLKLKFIQNYWTDENYTLFVTLYHIYVIEKDAFLVFLKKEIKKKIK